MDGLVGSRKSHKWIMAVTGNTVTAFLDESGKFKDHDVVCFGGVYSFNEHFNDFVDEWFRWLRLNGLEILTCKEALNFSKPLSKKNDRVGLEKRIEDLEPFIGCIRKHLLVVSGVAIDVAAFKKQPSHLFQAYHNDPCYVAFTREILQIIDFEPSAHGISLICDEDEETVENFYKLYRRVKKVWPKAKGKLAGITFADDTVVQALQAADLVTSLIRLEAGRKMLNIPYDYGKLWDRLNGNSIPGERIWQVEVSFNDESTLTGLATDLKKEWDEREIKKGKSQK